MLVKCKNCSQTYEIEKRNNNYYCDNTECQEAKNEYYRIRNQKSIEAKIKKYGSIENYKAQLSKKCKESRKLVDESKVKLFSATILAKIVVLIPRLFFVKIVAFSFKSSIAFDPAKAEVRETLSSVNETVLFEIIEINFCEL